MRWLTRPWRFSLALLGFTLALAAALVWHSVPHFPASMDAELHCGAGVPAWPAAQPLSVLSFNVQYMAGKNYVFYYDVAGGPDSRPAAEDVRLTLDGVAALIRQQAPDLVLLQEINDADDSRTHYIDQLPELQRRLGDLAFPCLASAHYWKAGWIPHPHILGPVSMQLVTLSRYRLAAARRYQLPRMDKDPLTRHFYFQRALLDARLQTDAGAEVAVLNTHFDAWGKGSPVMAAQVARVVTVLDELEQRGIPWLLGGDFNLLPPDDGRQWQRLRQHYDRPSPLLPLYRRFGAIPSLADLNGAGAARWYTHFPNDPAVTAPDRTIDYLFYSRQWQRLRGDVLREEALTLSDHLPVLGEFALAKP